MEAVTLADAKARLSELVEQAASGDSVLITRRGKPVAQIMSIDTPRKPIDLDILRALTARVELQSAAAGEFVRGMRDEDRY